MKIPNLIDILFPKPEQIRRFVEFCERRPWLILTITILITAWATYGTVRLYSHVDTSLTALLPDHYRSVITLKKIDQEGGKNFENLLAEGDDPEMLKAFAENVKMELEKDPAIFRVDVTREVVIAKEHALLTLDDERLKQIHEQVSRRLAKLKLQKSGFFVSLFEDEEDLPQGANDHLGFAELKKQFPGMIVKQGTNDEYLFSTDGKVIDIHIFPVKPFSDLANTDKVYRAIRGVTDTLQAKYPSIKTYNYGPYRKRLDEISLIKSDLGFIGLITILAIVISVMFYFRQIVAVIMISIPLAIGLLCTMGVADIVIGGLNTITSFLVGILTGLGIDYSIHFYSRYLEERREGRARNDALVTSISTTGRAALTSGFNTSLVFFSLAFADFKGFSEFGLISGIGLLLCYFAIYLILPYLLIWFEKWGILKTEPSKTFFSLPWPSLPRFITDGMTRFPLSRTLVGFAVFVVVVFCFVAPRLQFEYDFGKLRSDLISYDTELKVLERFPTASNMGNTAIMILNSREDIPAVRAAIDEKIRVDTQTPSLRGFFAIDNTWPTLETQKRRAKIIGDIKDLLPEKTIKHLKGKDREEAEEFLEYLDVKTYPIEAVSHSIKNFFSPRGAMGDKIGTYGYVLASYKIRTKDGRDAMKFAEDAREIVTERGTFEGSSPELVFADVLGLMLKESRRTIFIAIAIIALSVWLDFNSFWKTAIVLCPLAVGMMLTLILLHAFGGKITFYNMITIPMIIGMGEDNAVHTYHRYLELGKGSIAKTMRSKGMSIWMASVTAILGFLGLMFSHHNGLRSIGILAAAGMLGCLFCSLLVLPAMVQFLEDREKMIH